MKLGSLFDGAGGFPFAGQQYGIEPAWASEIEPFPIAVTSKHFPNMKHLGDVTKINGAEIEPVDIITFGSPCQDLSVAGKRAGLDGERSGLFMEAIRIIKEMRGATNGVYPRIAVWENVYGAYISNKGEDFRKVLEAFCRIIDGKADIPRPPKGKWAHAGEIMGDGYSVAWRTLDAKYWGVPQRRRRIFLVADFTGGGGARKILFEREGLSRHFAESRATWKGITKPLAFGAGAQSGNSCYCLQGNGIDRADTAGCNGRGWPENVSYTLNTVDRPAVVAFPAVYDARGNGDGNVVPTITGDHENRITDYTAVVLGFDGYNAAITGEIMSTLGTNAGISSGRSRVLAFHLLQDPIASNDFTPCLSQGSPNGEACIGIVALDRAAFNQGRNAKYDPGIDGESGKAFTVISRGPGAVCYMVYPQRTGALCAGAHPGSYTGQDAQNDMLVTLVDEKEIILRRLTPDECARLQGMPDWWCDGIPHSDSAEYKMWGNGMALPCVMYVMEGVAELLKERGKQ